ncbi:MAG: hypothetical protein KDE08_07685 [Rhodobacteraceae bacterium]|nr:hypothetical protein [Paracoccaceae bacterium]
MSVEQCAYEHTLDKLRNQQAYLAALRSQAAVASAVTGLVATVFATLIGREGMQPSLHSTTGPLGISLPVIFLIFCFGGSLACSVLVLVGWRPFTFEFDIEKLLDRRGEYPTTKDFYVKYSRDGEYYFKQSESSIQEAQNMLWFAMLLGWVQILPWLMILLGSPDV